MVYNKLSSWSWKVWCCIHSSNPQGPEEQGACCVISVLQSNHMKIGLELEQIKDLMNFHDVDTLNKMNTCSYQLF